MNKRTLLYFINLLFLNLISNQGVFAQTSKPKVETNKIEVEDPLLEDELFQDSVSEEVDKTKVTPKDLGVQVPPSSVQQEKTSQTPTAQTPNTQEPVLEAINKKSSNSSKQNDHENSDLNQADAINANKIKKNKNIVNPDYFELSKKSNPNKDDRVSKNIQNKEDVSIDSGPRWNARDPRKGFVEVDDQGVYYYKEESMDSGVKEYKDEVKVKPKPSNYDKGLQSVSSDGVYRYKIEESEMTGSSSVRFGSIPPLSIENKRGISYEEVYGDSPITVMLFDYDWLAFKKFGHWVLSVGSGLGLKDGQGVFIDDFTQAKEVYSLHIILNHISFIYRFQYTKRPWFVPYVSVGAVPTILFERRDDNKRNKIAFSPSVQGSGGVRLNIGRIDQDDLGILDSEYGINNMWLDVEYRRLQSFTKETDISSNIFNVGMGFDF